MVNPKFPWDEIVRHGPTMVNAASSLWEKWKVRQPESVDPNAEVRTQLAAIVLRLQALEESESAQGELLKNMATQMQDLSRGIAELSSSLTRARQLALAALAVAAVALIITAVVLFAVR